MSTKSCIATSIIPTIVIYCLFGFYFLCAIITSVRSFTQLQATNRDWQQYGYGTKFIFWIKDIKRRKQCYLEILPHLIDQATDIGVIISFYYTSAAQRSDPNVCDSLNLTAMFCTLIVINITYRLISAIQIYFYTKNIRQFIFQLLDIEFIEALAINYKCTNIRSEPCEPQRWISIMEATFESVPQAIVQLIYLIVSGLFATSFGIVHISFIWSMLTIILRSCSEDARLFECVLSERLKARLQSDNILQSEWATVPSKYFLFFPMRSMDLFSRIFTLSLSYIYLPFSIFVAINATEILFLFIVSAKTKRYIILNHLIRCQLDLKLLCQRLFVHSIWCALLSAYSSISIEYIFVVTMVPILIMLIMYYFIYKKIKWFDMMNREYFNEPIVFTSSRNLNYLIKCHHWNDVMDLINFGFDTNPNELIQKYPDLFVIICEDFEMSTPFRDYLMDGLKMDVNKFVDIWCGTLQALENKETGTKIVVDRKILRKSDAKVIHIDNEDEFKELIAFQQSLLQNSVCANNLEEILNATTKLHHRTLIHILALKRKGLKFLSQVLDHQVIKPNILDVFDETALHIISKDPEDDKSIDIAETLLKNNNIDINMINKSCNNETPLHYSIKNQSPTLCNLFLQHATINIEQTTISQDTYLLYSAKRNNEDITLQIINNDRMCDVNAQNSAGNTALHLTVTKHRVFTTLMSKYRNTICVNTANNDGVVCLMSAASAEDNNISVDLLINHHKININATDKNGNNALHHIILNDKIQYNFAKILSHPGIDVNLQNNVNVGGLSALHMAYSMETNKDYTIYHKMKLLLEHKNININLQTLTTGDTALHFAVSLSNYLKCIRRKSKLILLVSQKNINCKISNNKKQTPWMVAANQWEKTKNKLEVALRRFIVLQQQSQKLQRVMEIAQNRYESARQAYSCAYSSYEEQCRAFEQQISEMDTEDRDTSAFASYNRPSPPSSRVMDEAHSQYLSALGDFHYKQQEVEKQNHIVQIYNVSCKAAAEMVEILRSYKASHA